MAGKEKRWRVNSGIDYVVSDEDHKLVVASFAQPDESKRIDPLNPENGIKTRRIEAGRVVSNLPERVVAALADTFVVIDGEQHPVLEEVTDG
jgi:hypothetical protein